MTDATAPLLARISGDLATGGWSVVPDFLAADHLPPLRESLLRWWAEGDFHRAGVGRGPDRQVVSEIRGDYVRWLELGRGGRFHGLYHERFEPLRLAVNQALYLGLWELEAHVTVYPPGAYYVRHLDRFRDAPHRVLSVILYLNEDWQPEDGGELRLYLPGPDGGETVRDVPPRAGTLVTFLSDTIWHEVLPARRDRLSFTGWFRRRP